MREKICKAAYESDKFQNITYCNLSWYLLQSLGLYQTSPTMAFPIHHPCYLKSDCGLASWLHLTSYRFPNPYLPHTFLAVMADHSWFCWQVFYLSSYVWTLWSISNPSPHPWYALLCLIRKVNSIAASLFVLNWLSWQIVYQYQMTRSK